MVYLKSADSIKQKGLYWVEHFNKIKEENPDKQIVIVAMSRKMPRLIEVFIKILEILRESECVFITEHVLPYFLKDFDPKHQIILIVDDAMYYGSTINLITGYIKQINKEADVRVLPVVRSEQITALNYAEFGYDNLSNESSGIISDQDIPFFTTWCAKLFIELGRPLDMEFPILHLKINRGNFSHDKLFDTLKNVFDENNYVVYSVDNEIIRHKKITDNTGNKVDDNEENEPLEKVSNYSVLPKEGSRFDHWNKDFSKLRFFVTDSDVQVVAYAPGLLSEDDITSSKTLFSDTRIQSLWEMVKTHGMASWPEDEEVSYIAKNLRNAYKKQCFRSKVIWINYLTSFLYLIEQKESINKVISNLSDMFVQDAKESAYIDKKDTCQLLPEQLLDDITRSLNNYYREGPVENSAFFGIQSEVIANQELIPDDYREEYIKRTRRGMQRCSTASEALSVLFSQQLLILKNDDDNRNDILRRAQRLQFGITYNAMKNLLSFPIGSDGLWYQIHKWIDKNIDAGSIKPYYERIVNKGIAYWVRMFRAGENDDSFNKMRSICEFIIGKLRKKENRGYVSRTYVEDLLSLAWEDPCKIIKHKYKWDSFNLEKDENCFSLTYKTPNGKVKKFLDFLKRQDFLMNLDDSQGVARLATLDESPVVTPLDKAQEEAISDYVDTYFFYKKTMYQTFIMNNFFQQSDFKEDYKRLGDWRYRFSDYVREALSEEGNTEGLSEKFGKFDEELSNIIRQTIKADTVEDGKDKDEKVENNKIRIREHLQRTDNENYIRFKKIILETAATKVLFHQLFIISKEQRRSTKALKSLLNYLPSDDTRNVLYEYIETSDENRSLKENKDKISFAIQSILKNDAA